MANLTIGIVPVATGATQIDDSTITQAAESINLTRALKVPTFAFAALPAAPATGMLAIVNNSTTVVWGATITAPGANTVLAFYNGANWTVAGK